MPIDSHKLKEINEIGMHVQEIISEMENQISKQEELNEITVIQENVGKTAGDLDISKIEAEDVFDVFERVDEKEIDESVTKMTQAPSLVGFCDMCGQKISFEENLSGLVIFGKHFACEKCCQDASREDLEQWTINKMAKPDDAKPIAFWLMELKNKEKLF
jgi:hypothetical protein